MWSSSFPERFWGCGPSRGALDDAALTSMDMEAVGVVVGTGLLLYSVVVVVGVVGASSPAAAAAASAAARFK